MSPQPYIVCPKCGMVSHNPNDVENRYCGNCHAFHDDLLNPGYWMNETGGELAPAVMRYLEGLPLSERDITLIRLYFQQWIGSSVWDRNPARTSGGRDKLERLRELARVLNNRGAIDAWLTLAVDFGVDPL